MFSMMKVGRFGVRVCVAHDGQVGFYLDLTVKSSSIKSNVSSGSKLGVENDPHPLQTATRGLLRSLKFHFRSKLALSLVATFGMHQDCISCLLALWCLDGSQPAHILQGVD